MKRALSFLLIVILLLASCKNAVTKEVIQEKNQVNSGYSAETAIKTSKIAENEAVKFNELSDPALLQYVEDNIYADLENKLGSDNYIIEDISAVYVSKEYLEELEYNSKKNIYFGYTLEELDAQFEGTRYVFTLGDNGETIVKEFEEYDDTYEKIIKNVAIGAGVILICVTVSVVSGGIGAASVSTTFIASAKTATEFALSWGLISGVSTGVVTQFQTGDFEQSLKKASLSASEGFKWGAITGAIVGGAGKALELSKASKVIPSPRESELRALEKYGGREQASFLNGREVPMGTLNSTRPDIVRDVNGVLEAIEVKRYNLENPESVSALYKELKRQVTSRVQNLPKGSTQRIVLDVKGRNYSKGLIETVVGKIKETVADVYQNIPVDILR